jgi:hypothetical protein
MAPGDFSEPINLDRKIGARRKKSLIFLPPRADDRNTGGLRGVNLCLQPAAVLRPEVLRR